MPKSVSDEAKVQSRENAKRIEPTDKSLQIKLSAVAGCLRYEGKPKTLSQMRKAIQDKVRERQALGRY